MGIFQQKDTPGVVTYAIENVQHGKKRYIYIN